jgi:hypothetical protein
MHVATVFVGSYSPSTHAAKDSRDGNAVLGLQWKDDSEEGETIHSNRFDL